MLTTRHLVLAIFLAPGIAAADDSATSATASTNNVSISSPIVKSKDSGSKKRPEALTLGTVTTDVEGDLTIVTARLNQSPDWKNVELEEHGTFLQVKLPQTLIPASGEFLDGSGPFLRKLASFQLGNEDGALRLFISQDAAKAKMASSAELLGDRIVITIDHKKLEQLTSSTANIAPVTSDASTNSSASMPSPSTTQPEGFQKQDSADSVNRPKQDNLHVQLTKGAAVCAILFFALLTAQFLKLRRKRGHGQSKVTTQMEPVAMKLLSSISVGQKQKLTLVQVGNQQLLLGVTPENITLLTNIGGSPQTNPFAKALETANPNAEVRLKNPAEISASSPRKALTTPTARGRSINSSKGSSVNIGIGEDGAVDMRSPSKTEEDITKILRDRLRNLPPG